MPDGQVWLKNLAALGRAYNRSHDTARSWVRHKNWPADVPRRGPWGDEYKPAIDAFVDNLGASKNPSGLAKPLTADEAEAELRYKVARAKRMELANAVTTKRLHDRAKCERRMLAAIHAVKTGLAGIAQSLPAELAGAERGHWCQTIQSRFDELCQRFAEAVGPNDGTG